MKYQRQIWRCTLRPAYALLVVIGATLLVSSAMALGTLTVPTTGTVRQYFGLNQQIPDYSHNYYDEDDNLVVNTSWIHDGVDIQEMRGSDCTQEQSPVYAAAAGKVIWADWQKRWGYNVQIANGSSVSSSGKYVFTRYAHMGTVDVEGERGTSCIEPGITRGVRVTAGQLIGYQGVSGRATGVHLHWGVYANPSVNVFTDTATLPASPDFYACIDLTDPSSTSSVSAGDNICPPITVVNGDFEVPTVGGARQYNPGKTFGKWTVGSGPIEHIGEGYWEAASGLQSVDLDGTCGAGSVYQDLTLIPATVYTLSFSMAGNPEGDPPVKTMEVWWGGALIDTLTFDTTGYSNSNMGWVDHEYTVVAPDIVTRLEFKSLTAGCYGPALDNVQLAEQ